MRINGTISFGKLPSEPLFNDDGEPLAVPVEWSTPVECFIQDITEDRRTRTEGGLYTARTFEVLVEGRACHAGELVRLTRHGRELGEYSVSRVKSILMDRMKIYV
ncbi:MAG: hypothetical protein NC344_10175 [Bacteroidales bacterium]|nr:hypothetical protein [Bacteroidales bacterium]MCM1148170.1 hypothetical protein [Bacteroidales bacterium]MCM1207103.1 hypothetical protein [Bacillota bacterium]MCM1510855.1 hypothetical protein [Clostridium sp.]